MNFKSYSELPIRITPCPIIEATVELRFESNIPYDAIYGYIYNEFKNDYSNFESLPITKIPEELRRQDGNLRFKPYYKADKDNFIFRIGPNVLTLSNTKEYTGWKSFSYEIRQVLAKFENLKITDKLFRLGIRYINALEENIFDNITLELLYHKNKLNNNKNYIRTQFHEADYNIALMLSNHAELTSGQDKYSGSVVDIDVSIGNLDISFFDNMGPVIEEAHNREKFLFFNLLNMNFLNTLSPEYGG